MRATGADMFLSNGGSFAADGSWTSVGFGSSGWLTGDFSGDGTADLLRIVSGGTDALI